MPGNKKKFQPPKKSKKLIKQAAAPKVTQFARMAFTEMTAILETHNRQWFVANMMREQNDFLVAVCEEYKMDPTWRPKNQAELSAGILQAVKDRHGL